MSNEQYHEKKLYHLLHSNFKIDEFRNGQRECMLELMKGRSLIYIQKTGSGKSLLFEMAALVMEGIVIVMVPLNALIANHARSAAEKGIPYMAYHSETDATQLTAIKASIAKCEPLREKLFLITPERMLSDDFRTTVLEPLYDQNRIALFVFDEIHVASGWGKDFRPNCRNADFRDAYARVPCLMLTASATSATLVDVQRQFRLQDAVVYRGDVNRPNIDYTVLGTMQLAGTKERTIVNFLKQKFQKPVADIIYVLSIQNTALVATMLTEELRSGGWVTAAFHAQLPPDTKVRLMSEWLAGRIHIMVSTCALGMGIDKRDISFVVHHSIPRDLDAFYQESGRGARDAAITAYSLCFYEPSLSKWFIKSWKDELETAMITKATYEEKLRKLEAMQEYCCTRGCRRSFLVKYFNPMETVECNGTCDNCRSGSAKKAGGQRDVRDFMAKRTHSLLDPKKKINK